MYQLNMCHPTTWACFPPTKDCHPNTTSCPLSLQLLLASLAVPKSCPCLLNKQVSVLDHFQKSAHSPRLTTQ
jgi:hypothetical protein